MLKKITVALIKWYQKSISPRKSRPCCRFYPTCSTYALKAVEEWGTLCGLFLAGKRILKCHPWGAEGIDPVPIRHRKRRAPVESETELRQGIELLALCQGKQTKYDRKNRK
jgi:putative membrane protein insertion efficiency factor